MNQKRLQLCAWVLLTVGLCIVVTTFYLAIQQNTGYNDSVAVADGKNLDPNIDLDNVAVSTIISSSDTGLFNVANEEPSHNRTGR